MLQVLRTFVEQYTQPKAPTSLTTSTTHLPEQPAQALEYGKMRKAILVTELNDAGDEVPVALAFMTDADRMHIVMLGDLCDLED